MTVHDILAEFWLAHEMADIAKNNAALLKAYQDAEEALGEFYAATGN